MLVPFVIDANSLAPDASWTPAAARACHTRLLDTWQRIGLLVHDGTTFTESSLNHKVATLPQNLRTLWQEILQRAPLKPISNGWTGSVTSKALGQISEMALLALVDDATAEVEFGLTEDEDERVNSTENGHGIDICRLVAAGNALPFKEAIDKAGRHIEARDSWEQTWNSRFAALARAPIKIVSVVDRYALEQHYKCPQTHLSGFARFLRLLDDTDGSDRYLTLYSARTPELAAIELKEIIRAVQDASRFSSGANISRIALYMVPDGIFAHISHDRFIRFGDYAWDLGLGLRVFEGSDAGSRSQASFKAGVAVREYKAIEEELVRARNVQRFTIRN